MKEALEGWVKVQNGVWYKPGVGTVQLKLERNWHGSNSTTHEQEFEPKVGPFQTLEEAQVALYEAMVKEVGKSEIQESVAWHARHPTINLKDCWKKNEVGDHLTDGEMKALVDSMEAALPYIENRPGYGVIVRDTHIKLAELRGFLRSRAREKEDKPACFGIPKHADLPYSQLDELD